MAFIKIIRFSAIAACLILAVTIAAQQKERPMGQLAYTTPRVKYEFRGIIGDRIQANLENWLLPAPTANPGILEMFRVRDRKPVPQLVDWAGEFIGKYLISAIQARRMVQDPRLDRLIRDTIAELISTQAEDGYLGPFRKEERLLKHWDLWGHYHAITALLMWYEDTGDVEARDCAVRAGDCVCGIYLDTDRRPLEAGSDEMNLSILTAMGRLYRHTGNERYLQMMRKVEKDWEKAGDYFRQGLAGVDFYKIPRPRWESLHDIQGLVELYRITGNEDYKTSFVNLWRSIQRLDRHNTGGFSTGEQAVGNPYTPGAIETCCTTAWAALSLDMLLLTGESAAADELEWSLYNSILGSQHPSGRWWTYNTPMDGKREASAHTIVFQSRAGTPELNCCSVNAPRGLGMISEWGVVEDSTGTVALNYYGPMDAHLSLPGNDKESLDLHVDSEYPCPGVVMVEVGLEKAAKFSLKLRIPAWSKKSRVILNNHEIGTPDAGTYFTLDREWRPKDRIEIYLDFSLWTWIGDGDALGKVSLYQGPLLLAFDQRDNEFDCDAIPALDYRNLESKDLKPEGKFPPLILKEFTGVDGQKVRLRDYATAGAAGTEYHSWLPIQIAPPPPFHLLEPGDQARIPKGPVKLTWVGSKQAGQLTYLVEISEEDTFSKPVVSEDGIQRNYLILRKELEPGKTYYWRVTSRNDQGASPNEGGPRAFTVDPSLENPFIDHPALLDFRDDGLVAGSFLDGDGTPVYGYLEQARKVEPAKDRSGKDNGAVAFKGEGMLRYKTPPFPSKEYSFTAWVCVDEYPVGRIGQIFSAWARGGDDPLRVLVEGDHLFARIEGAGNWGTPGVKVPKGEWIHLAAVKRGGHLEIWVNGKKAAECGAPGELLNSACEAFALGGNPFYPGSEFFVGKIDDFALYARALSDEEIARIHTQGLQLEKN
ncbi:MAG: glycoside hydrolase family 127 protein [Candidatus Omnitrophica bacterium]|nr:glycoside hydrolase family 127 protein [Candidatus Omnitrophota bacterium]